MGSEPRIVTQDIRDIPSHCVPLSSFGGRRHKRGGSWEYETLHTLCKRRDIKHWKFERGRTGQLFVEPETARTMLDSMRHQRIDAMLPTGKRPTQGKSEMDAAIGSLADIGSTLVEIRCVLERLTNAVESIATQPKTAQQELLATMSSNGFHN